MKIRGGMLLARALQEKGVQQVFTLSGGFCNPALEGFMDCGIPVINAPSEQAAGHLADGYTRITRKPAVCLVGPEGFADAGLDLSPGCPNLIERFEGGLLSYGIEIMTGDELQREGMVSDLPMEEA